MRAPVLPGCCIVLSGTDTNDLHSSMLLSMYMKRKPWKLRTGLTVSARQGKKSGRLHGVVIGIKDVICYKDHPVTAGSGILEGFDSPYHATAVKTDSG